MKKKPTIALCMIARDEAGCIGAALAAARPFCDEMIVVDTGSRDDTRSVATAAGARVIDAPWEEDFARARNISLDAASSDFILVLDADEVIDAAAGAALLQAVQRTRTLGVFLPIINLIDGGQEIPALILRAFRRRDDVRFTGRIHEQVLTPLNRLAAAGAGDLVQIHGRVEHHGYHSAVVAARGKNERNRHLFELALADTPGDLYLRWKFADFLRRFPDESARISTLLHDAAADVARLSRAAVRSLPFAAEVFALLAQLEADRGQGAAALAAAERGMALTCPTPNLRFVRARIALDDGDHTAAATGFRACLADHGKPMVIPGQPGVTSFLAAEGLTQTLLAAGDIDGARVAAEAGLAVTPDRPALYRVWLAAAARSSNPSDALRFLVTVVTADASQADAWLAGGELLAGLGLMSDARTWLTRAAAVHPQPTRALSLLAACALHEGDLDGALDSAQLALARPFANQPFASSAASASNPPSASPATNPATNPSADPTAIAVVATVAALAGVEVPDHLDLALPAVRQAFSALAAAWRRTPDHPVLSRLLDIRRAPPTFDPPMLALLVDALGPDAPTSSPTPTTCPSSATALTHA